MKPLLSLCSVPVAAMRDGYTGANAKLLIPFAGWWYASGATLTFPGSTIGQAVGTTLGGNYMVDNYTKDGVDCNCS